MLNYRIADLNVLMSPNFNTLKKQSEYYKESFIKPDFTINVTDDEIKDFNLKHKHLTLDDCEYLLTGVFFYRKLIEYSGIILHSSAICMDNRAYLFSAPSGIGKSTHAALWQRYFGEENAIIINDDKPAIRYIDDKFYAFGTPWSGKTDKNKNIKVPIKGICFLNRAEENKIQEMSSKSALFPLLDQTLRPVKQAEIDMFSSIVSMIIDKIPIYKLSCNMDVSAVETAYRKLKEA